MKPETIQKELLKAAGGERASQPMLTGEIPGAAVYHHMLPAGQTLISKALPIALRIFFLCDGSASFSAGGKSAAYAEKAVFVPALNDETAISAQTNAGILEIQWAMNDKDLAEICETKPAFPITARYVDAMQYRDPFKSEKTISRAIIPHRVLPRFAMGSVETYGDDLIGQHEHPLLDQFFFSFGENHMDLLLDDIVYPLGGDTLLHIPLGCNHGVSVKGDQIAHYIWIDFATDPEKANAYLDDVHKATGTHRSFQ